MLEGLHTRQVLEEELVLEPPLPIIVDYFLDDLEGHKDPQVLILYIVTSSTQILYQKKKERLTFTICCNLVFYSNSIRRDKLLSGGENRAFSFHICIVVLVFIVANLC